MDFREQRPVGPVSNVVRCFWSLEYDGRETSDAEPVLPDGCPEIVFNLADRFQRLPRSGPVETQSAAIISGQLRTRIMIRPTGRVRLFGIRFQPHAGSLLLGFPMSELTDQILPLEDVAAGRFDRLADLLHSAGTFDEMVNAAQMSLLASVIDLPEQGLIAAALARSVAERGGSISVRELSGLSGIGERRIERIFQKYVGLPPKLFGRILRFQSVVRSVESGPSFDLVDTALAFGYFDQSHMIHDFREFAGISPVAYFAATRQLSQAFVSADQMSDSYNTAGTLQP